MDGIPRHVCSIVWFDMKIHRFQRCHEFMSFGLRLWATQNLFSHPRYKDGAATSPNFDSFAYGCVAGPMRRKNCFGRCNVWDGCAQLTRAEAQTKKMLDVGKKLDAETHVFWGGREGFATALNTKDRSALRCATYRRVKWIEMCRCECEILLQRVITYDCCRSRASLTTWPHSWKWRWLTKRRSDLVHNSPLSQKLVSQLHINMTMTPKRSLAFCISWEPRKGMEQWDPCIHCWLVGLHCAHLQFCFKSFPKLEDLDQCNENYCGLFLVLCAVRACHFSTLA